MPVVMGVLNVTPDSFSDGGRYVTPAAARAAAEAMVAAGVAIIDIGGESTRPGAPPVPLDEERRRVLPVVEALADLPCLLSIDTSQPQLMREAIQRGVALINDVRALTNEGAIEAVVGAEVGVCLMHMRGSPATMQRDPRYADVVSEVRAFLLERVQACMAAGIDRSRIAIDPGFGFGKTLAHNLALFRALPQFAATGLPVVVGLSRKSMIGALTGRSVDDRLAGSIALATLAADRGARIIRAHDVAQTVDALRIVAALHAEE